MPLGLWCNFTVFQKLKSLPDYFRRETIPSSRRWKDENPGQKLKATIFKMQNILSKYLIHISVEISWSSADRTRLQLHEHLKFITNQNCCGKNQPHPFTTTQFHSFPLHGHTQDQPGFLHATDNYCTKKKNKIKTKQPARSDSGCGSPCDSTDIWGER